MDFWSTLGDIVRYLLIFVAVTTCLLVVLVVIIANMPRGNPLKRLLTAFTYRIAATVAAGALAIPLEPIPGVDAIYDIGAPLLLLIYWISFFRNAGRTMSAGRAPPTPPAIADRR